MARDLLAFCAYGAGSGVFQVGKTIEPARGLSRAVPPHAALRGGIAMPWRALLDSNQRPTASKAVALSI
jgi:hypothetical protein